MFFAKFNIFILSLSPIFLFSSIIIDVRFGVCCWLLAVGVSIIFLLSVVGHAKKCFFPLVAATAAAAPAAVNRLSNCNVNLHSCTHHLSAVVVNIERRPRVNAYKSFLMSFLDQNFHQLSFSFRFQIRTLYFCCYPKSASIFKIKKLIN